jgi:hypothetical protein
MRRLRYLPCERERRLALLHAAAVAAHVDLDIDRQGDPASPRRRVERADLARIVGADANPGDMRERDEAPQFLAADHLVGDEHVRDAALDHRLGLADLLNAHADGAERDLLQGDDRTFVRLSGLASRTTNARLIGGSSASETCSASWCPFGMSRRARRRAPPASRKYG